MTDDDWQALLDHDPADAELRLAYATWLRDEANDPVAAECMEWLAREGKRPDDLCQQDVRNENPFVRSWLPGDAV